jgi:hypothetical protein
VLHAVSPVTHISKTNRISQPFFMGTTPFD